MGEPQARLFRQQALHLEARDSRDLDECPRPDKRFYPTKAMAKGELRRYRSRTGLAIYRCACGGFHIGHRRPR